MSLPAFYHDSDLSDSTISLIGSELAHALVIRLRPGEQVEIFNGRGTVARGTIGQITKKRAEVVIDEVNHIPPRKSRAIVATAVSKAVRRGFFMEKATELGAWEIWVWRSARSVGSFSPSLLDSCRQQIIAGGKQSRNPWFPKLVNVDSLAGLLHRVAERKPAALLLPWEDQSRQIMLSPEQLQVVGDTVFAIGPEGGYTQEEVDALEAAQFAPVSLGSQVLRSETAAVLCLGLHSWASQLPGAPDYADPQ